MCTSLTKDVVPEWQGAASCLLTTLGITHAPAVLQELLKRFQPGTTPHYFVVKTTGDLAMANGENLNVNSRGTQVRQCLFKIMCGSVCWNYKLCMYNSYILSCTYNTRPSHML